MWLVLLKHASQLEILQMCIPFQSSAVWSDKDDPLYSLGALLKHAPNLQVLWTNDDKCDYAYGLQVMAQHGRRLRLFQCGKRPD